MESILHNTCRLLRVYCTSFVAIGRCRTLQPLLVSLSSPYWNYGNWFVSFIILILWRLLIDVLSFLWLVIIFQHTDRRNRFTQRSDTYLYDNALHEVNALRSVAKLHSVEISVMSGIDTLSLCNYDYLYLPDIHQNDCIGRQTEWTWINLPKTVNLPGARHLKSWVNIYFIHPVYWNSWHNPLHPTSYSNWRHNWGLLPNLQSRIELLDITKQNIHSLKLGWSRYHNAGPSSYHLKRKQWQKSPLTLDNSMCFSDKDHYSIHRVFTVNEQTKDGSSGRGITMISKCEIVIQEDNSYACLDWRSILGDNLVESSLSSGSIVVRYMGYVTKCTVWLRRTQKCHTELKRSVQKITCVVIFLIKNYSDILVHWEQFVSNLNFKNNIQKKKKDLFLPLHERVPNACKISLLFQIVISLVFPCLFL